MSLGQDPTGKNPQLSSPNNQGGNEGRFRTKLLLGPPLSEMQPAERRWKCGFSSHTEFTLERDRPQSACDRGSWSTNSQPEHEWPSWTFSRWILWPLRSLQWKDAVCPLLQCCSVSLHGNHCLDLKSYSPANSWVSPTFTAHLQAPHNTRLLGHLRWITLTSKPGQF